MGCHVSKQNSSQNNPQYIQNSSQTREKKSSLCSIQYQVNKYNLEGELGKNIHQQDQAGINLMDLNFQQKNESQINPGSNTGYQYSSSQQNQQAKSQQLNSDKQYYYSYSYSSSSSSSSCYYENEEQDDYQSDSNGSGSQSYYGQEKKENKYIYIINQTQNVNNYIKNQQQNSINQNNLQDRGERKTVSVNNF
ncbi:hypothetical protein PPERSA_09000 [Pseudocohnilembus persalinus]|uniref:Uncharacterized protein n=1 Tax=Pseudocohnilembus persalinus TaxID=266149 RepID=A0A0V0R3J9_PSEPJ|nr:hypothetical protein PPERSA_09000 [Pseudocohnilembus persalinus]|eukprot:KRX08896.1 hypothetical protein PPERSA_09000 [Pseudocohnilembus persalinus]